MDTPTLVWCILLTLSSIIAISVAGAAVTKEAGGSTSSTGGEGTSLISDDLKVKTISGDKLSVTGTDRNVTVALDIINNDPVPNIASVELMRIDANETTVRISRVAGVLGIACNEYKHADNTSILIGAVSNTGTGSTLIDTTTHKFKQIAAGVGIGIVDGGSGLPLIISSSGGGAAYMQAIWEGTNLQYVFSATNPTRHWMNSNSGTISGSPFMINQSATTMQFPLAGGAFRGQKLIAPGFYRYTIIMSIISRSTVAPNDFSENVGLYTTVTAGGIPGGLILETSYQKEKSTNNIVLDTVNYQSLVRVTSVLDYVAPVFGWTPPSGPTTTYFDVTVGRLRVMVEYLGPFV